MHERKQTPLTPEQAADVINYFDQWENARSYENGWKRKVPLARVALHAAMKNYSILPSGEALLSFDEANTGLAHLNHKDTEAVGGWPVEPSDEQWEQIEHIAETRPSPLDEAYYQVMGVKPAGWK